VKGQTGLVDEKIAKKVNKVLAQATTAAGVQISFNG